MICMSSDFLGKCVEDPRGPAGRYLVQQRRRELREAYFELLGKPRDGFSLPARVLAIRGRVAFR